MQITSNLAKEYKIRDPIYGFIRLDAQEMDVVNSPYFQRLRRIKQLSLTDMVYPGATHNRFEHSLGVMQMASDMFDNIVKKEANLKRLGLTLDDLKRPRKILRLAALLHDVGHAPFSHSSEDLMPFYGNDRNTRYTHEDYSIEAIKNLFRDLIEKHKFGENHGIKAEDVTALIGDKKAVPTRSSVFWKELISGQVDADRADYLLRDSLHIGVSYGLYDRNMLVNSIVVGESEEAGSGFLAVEEGGWHVAESLVIARYQMFSQVYFHHARRAFDYHLGQATKKILEGLGSKGGLFPPPTSKGLRKFFEYDDCTIFSALKDRKGGEHGDIILNRSQYKCKKSWDRDLSEEELALAKEAIGRYGGFLDDGAATKWYKLDKDIKIFDEKRKEYAPLSYKSGLIRTMPALPKITRLYISQMNGGLDYEYNA